jgi:signal transduction histidine kinase/DNA-binding response OmpR family regulator
MILPKLILSIIFLNFFLVLSLFGQTERDISRETGLPIIQNFRPNEYHAGPNNFSIAQDERGLLYVANDRGVLIYDGVRWQLVQTPDNSIVRALCYSQDTIYVGAQNDLGYLAPNSHGQLEFVSLKPQVPEKNHEFKGIWEVLAIKDAIFFRSYYSIFRWVDKKFTVWKPERYFHNAYVVGDDFYVREHKIGLKKLVDDSLQLISDGEKLVNETFAALWENKNGRLTGITRFQGFWEHNGVEFQKIASPADSFLYKNLAFHAVRLPSGRIALATHRRGLALIDSTGHLLQVVDRNSGLRSNIINFVHSDKQGGLWVAMTNGLARIELPTPFTYFKDLNGLEESTNALIRHQGRLYAANAMGVFTLNDRAEPFPVFEQIKGISHTAWCFLSQPNRLLVGTHRGILSIEGDKATPVTGTIGVRKLLASSNNPNRIYVGQYRGVGLLEFLPQGEIRFRQIEGSSGNILDMIEDDDGVLWVGTRKGLFSVNFDENTFTANEKSVPAQITHYKLTHGLPEKSVRPVYIGKSLRFVSGRGIYYYDSDDSHFYRDNIMDFQKTDSLTAILRVREDSKGNVWIIGEKEAQFSHICLIKQPDGDYLPDKTFSNRLADLGDIYMIHPQPDGVVWFGGAEGLLRYDPDLNWKTKKPVTALVRSVRSVGRDTLLFGGMPNHQTNQLDLSYALNSLRFDYALPSYIQQESNKYQVKLKGFEANWSHWQTETHKDYTGLGPGYYTFQVRAQDAFGRTNTTDNYSFNILPPWYRTWWVYLIYAGVLVIIVSIIIRFRVAHLQAKARNLENLIAERTATVSQQAEKLKEMDRVKSRFFANISHEFRTPLTLILGPIDDMLEKTKHIKEKNQLDLIQRSAKRLQRLINQLLDLSQLETGKMQLQATSGDFVSFLKSVVMSFASLAESKQIILKFMTEPGSSNQDSSNIYFDRDKIEKIFSNLLSNAFKFTPPGGTVKVVVNSPQSSENGQYNVGNTIVTVSDTGQGISEEQLPFVFDRFYQTDSSTTREKEGSGIGLALVKELVKLHHGVIDVESKIGEGTTFKIQLPMGSQHLKDEEIIATAETAEVVQVEDVATRLIASSPLNKIDGTHISVEEYASMPESISTITPESIDEEETVILVVDDHPDVRRYIREQLQSGYTIADAENGEAGIQSALDIIPDLVISDVMMPILDGYALCEALKTDQRTSHIPVILLTARAGEEDKLAGLDTGADDYLVKPFNSKELNTRVRNLIDQRRKLREQYVREGMLRPTEVEAVSLDDQFIQQMMSVIEDRLQDENFSVEELSSKMNMGARHLHRKIRALTSKSPVEFIRLVRLQRARHLLEQNTGTISEIAYQVGIINLSYFSKSFKQEFGVLPSEIEETNQKLVQ